MSLLSEIMTHVDAGNAVIFGPDPDDADKLVVAVTEPPTQNTAGTRDIEVTFPELVIEYADVPLERLAMGDNGRIQIQTNRDGSLQPLMEPVWETDAEGEIVTDRNGAPVQVVVEQVKTRRFEQVTETRTIPTGLTITPGKVTDSSQPKTATSGEIETALGAL